MESQFVNLIHKKDGSKKSVIKRSMRLDVAEKALRDSERKANLNWELESGQPFEFKDGVLIEKKPSS